MAVSCPSMIVDVTEDSVTFDIVARPFFAMSAPSTGCPLGHEAAMVAYLISSVVNGPGALPTRR